MILCLLLQPCTVLSQELVKVDWNKVSLAWQQFLLSPTKSNGMRVYSILPSAEYRVTQTDSTYQRAWDSLYENLSRLAGLVSRQNRMAVRVAFRLYSISDADFTETLDQILGGLISVNPTMFLEELSAHRNLVGDLGGILGNLGEKFVDDTDAQNSEIRRRIRSLETIKATVLSRIRDACITELQSQIR